MSYLGLYGNECTVVSVRMYSLTTLSFFSKPSINSNKFIIQYGTELTYVRMYVYRYVTYVYLKSQTVYCIKQKTLLPIFYHKKECIETDRNH